MERRSKADTREAKCERLYLRLHEAGQLADDLGLVRVCDELAVQRARVRVAYLSLLQERWAKNHAR